MAKLYASKVVVEQTVEAVQIHGGYGFVKEYHVERLRGMPKSLKLRRTSRSSKNSHIKGVLKG